MRAQAISRSSSRLTLRETQAADLLLDGLANKGIAVKMGIAETTVKVMLQSIYRKKRVHTRGEFAARYAHLVVKKRGEQENAGQAVSQV